MLVALSVVLLGSAPVPDAQRDACAVALDVARFAHDRSLDEQAVLSDTRQAVASLNERDECYSALEHALRGSVIDHHRRAQKYKRADDYRRAVALYDVVLALPASAVTDRARYAFFRAEALWDLQEYQRAADGYRDVIAHDPSGEYALTSAFDRILALERVVRELPRSRELTDDERALLDALRAYRALVVLRSPRTERERRELSEVMVKEAWLLFEHGLPGARPLLADVAATSPDMEIRRFAAKLLEM